MCVGMFPPYVKYLVFGKQTSSTPVWKNYETTTNYLTVHKVEAFLFDYHAVSVCIQGRASPQPSLPRDTCVHLRGKFCFKK